MAERSRLLPRRGAMGDERSGGDPRWGSCARPARRPRRCAGFDQADPMGRAAGPERDRRRRGVARAAGGRASGIVDRDSRRSALDAVHRGRSARRVWTRNEGPGREREREAAVAPASSWTCADRSARRARRADSGCCARASSRDLVGSSRRRAAARGSGRRTACDAAQRGVRPLGAGLRCRARRAARLAYRRAGPSGASRRPWGKRGALASKATPPRCRIRSGLERRAASLERRGSDPSRRRRAPAARSGRLPSSGGRSGPLGRAMMRCSGSTSAAASRRSGSWRPARRLRGAPRACA